MSLLRSGGVPVALDLRCMQEDAQARFGIARLVMALLNSAAANGAAVLGIVDDRLPPLGPETAKLLTEAVPNGYSAHRRLAAAGVPAAFVSTAPLTHDGTYTGRLVSAPGILHAALVHDLFPSNVPEQFLTTPAARVAYATQLAWLAPGDLFAATSRSTADDLVRVLGVQPERVFVIGAPVGPDAAIRRSASERRRIMTVGSTDARRSPETVIIAHARSTRLQAEQVSLVIGGDFSGAEAAAFENLAAHHGGDPALLVVPGPRTGAELRSLYEDARIVVCPSVAEGFAQPVAEAMAAGAVVLATDIKVHAELVTDAENRFPVGDAAALALLLDAWWDRAMDANALLARQRATVQHFRPEAVGARFWSRLCEAVERTPASPAIHTGRRPKVAFMTPLPPDASGVADYTSRTCAEMAAVAEVHCYTPTLHPTPIPGVASIQPLSALPALLPTYDAVVAVAGNSRFHTAIVEHALEYGAAIVAHDARMLGFYRALMGLERALDVASSELGRPVTERELDEWMADERKLKALFLGELARAASPLVVHSPVTASLVRERHGVTPEYLPFSVYRHWAKAELSATARRAARDRLGLKDGELVLASFGLLSKDKAPDVCVRALAALRGSGVPARLHLVGGANRLDGDGAFLRALAESLDVAPYLVLGTEHVPEDRYKDLLAAADVGIQLRTFGLGGLSGAVLDCAAAGLPTVVNQSLWDAVQPPSYVWSIPDSLDPAVLARTVSELTAAYADRGTAEAERQSFSKTRGMRAYTRRLCQVVGLAG